MRHIDEFTMMMYVDDELSATEREEVAAHLSVCSACQQSCARWMTDQSRLERMFREDPPLSPAKLDELTWAQIAAIAAIHKRRRQAASRRPERFWAAVFAAVFAGALFVLTGASDWLSSIRPQWLPGSLFTVTFWLKEHGSQLLLYPIRNPAQIAALLFVLLTALIALNVRIEGNRRNRTSGGLDR